MSCSPSTRCPAVLAVSNEQFIVFASNAFAILGLRALYFLLADMHARFTYLQEGLAIILAFVGVKMIIAEWYHIPTALSLGVIAIVLTASIGFSLKDARRTEREAELVDAAFDDEAERCQRRSVRRGMSASGGLVRVRRSAVQASGSQRVELATRMQAGVRASRELFGIERARDGVALGDVAADVAQLLEDLLALDTFGDDFETEVVSEVDRRSDDHLVLLVDEHVGDEALVDLQLSAPGAGGGS